MPGWQVVLPGHYTQLWHTAHRNNVHNSRICKSETSYELNSAHSLNPEYSELFNDRKEQEDTPKPAQTFPACSRAHGFAFFLYGVAADRGADDISCHSLTRGRLNTDV